MPKKRVAVVGGGFCGLTSIRWLKEEGLEPVCFELTSKPGGTWCYRKETTEGVASIMPSTVINHSKELGALSDFPPKPEYSNYMRHHEMYRYLMEYSEHFDLLKYIQYNMKVTRVRRTGDYDVTGRWEVTFQNLVTREEVTDVYDGVLVCAGHINRPKMAHYPGQSEFKGKIIHTHSLKEVDEYKGQRVLVVGMGCSGMDAAVEISNVASQVYLSTRSGAWVFRRVSCYGYPLDSVIMRRRNLTTLYYLPARLLSWYLEKVYLDPDFDSDLYHVAPDHHVLSKDPFFNDYLFAKLMAGSIKQKKDIERFTEDGVVFEGDDTVTEVDSVVMATGYTWKFPFLESGLIVRDGARINLYKCMYPPQLQHPTLAILGFILVFGPGFPIGEMQSRLAARLIAGKCRLPSYEAMMEDIDGKYNYNKNRYQVNDKLSLRIDSITYLDEVAALIGAKPNFLKLLFTDFWLFYKLIMGPFVPYQYRLEGPHKWEGAREAIMTCEDRIRAPFIGDKNKSENKKSK